MSEPITSPHVRADVADALNSLLQERRWTDITMQDVSARARISRQTLYNEFGSRAGLVDAYVLDKANGFLDTVDEVLRAHCHDPVLAATRALTTFLDVVEDDALVRAVEAKTGASGLSAFVAAEVGAPVLLLASQRITALGTELWPELPSDELATIVEALVRLAISYMVVPSSSSEEAAARVRRTLEPYFESMTRAAG